MDSVPSQSVLPTVGTPESQSRMNSMLQHSTLPESAATVSNESIAESSDLSDEQKCEELQKRLIAASSNGKLADVKELLSAPCAAYIAIDGTDSDGASALIYAACFGHLEVVKELLQAGADPDIQDKFEWTPLMWAANNHHIEIASQLLDSGASLDLKTAAGRSALDFVNPGTALAELIKEKGFSLHGAAATATAAAGVGAGALDGFEDFYSPANLPPTEDDMFDQSRQDKLRFESMLNDDVKLDTSWIQDDFPAEPTEDDILNLPDFDWNRCLPGQMFVFSESDINLILDTSISKMQPQRSTTQKPIPANVIFLSARFALSSGDTNLLENLLTPAFERISDVVHSHKEDPSFLAYWLSNCSLLLYYLKKDTQLAPVTKQYQSKLHDLTTEIYTFVHRDAIRLMEKVLDQAMLEHDTIPGLDDVQFQHEWRLFRRRKTHQSFAEQDGPAYLPPPPKEKAKPSPRLITSILSSILFLFELYDVHPVISVQVMQQLFYWLGATIFNRVLSNHKYLSRTKAMQIRMNISMIEDWSSSNNFTPKFADETRNFPEDLIDLARTYLANPIQLLQWLQCFSGLEDDFDGLINTIQQLKALTPEQLLYAVDHYRAEVGEPSLSTTSKGYIKDTDKKYRIQMQEQEEKGKTSEKKSLKPPNTGLFMDASYVLPFSPPSYHEMFEAWGAGLGGVNSANAKKYQPSLPLEFVSALDDAMGSGLPAPKPAVPNSMGRDWDDLGTGTGSSTSNHWS
ncbi:hypothetical protein CANCADRAFT_23995 [Tortispora caseinolytica NRRL Y-17796]|uniref:Dilute domain-containing protein n=1 Tax=Tortispora caseinolytica NRRL Y-17796 TaxID=767744 RepID=A0A1E4TER8_9ASCO|nr:hypothetical protein CANCADRAFT_23995 [Tortispora caseinolytica NRRL Y-17796]